MFVGLSDDADNGVLLKQSLRIENLLHINLIDYIILLQKTNIEFLKILKPNIVLKGQEHQSDDIDEESTLILSYGGKILYSSGESLFSSEDLISPDMHPYHNNFVKVNSYLKRHKIYKNDIKKYFQKLNKLKVVVIGDIIIDEYINCTPIGMSQEDPIVVLRPHGQEKYIGGASIVAAHIAGTGANTHFIGVSGSDGLSEFVNNSLKNIGVVPHIFQDNTRPTTLKQRFRVKNNTLFRISNFRQHNIDNQIINSIFARICELIIDSDLLVFSDFSYGCLPSELVSKIINFCLLNNIHMTADSQTSSQIGDISRFHDMLLVTPTEHEARVSLGHQTSSISVLADNLISKSRAKNIIITLGGDGVFIKSSNSLTDNMQEDQLPALNSSPLDISGAGDCLLAYSSVALVSGASLWEAAYIGSIAAGCQVSRVGNFQLSASEVLARINN